MSLVPEKLEDIYPEIADPEDGSGELIVKGYDHRGHIVEVRIDRRLVEEAAAIVQK